MSQSHITNGYLYGFTGEAIFFYLQNIVYQVIGICASRLTKKKKTLNWVNSVNFFFFLEERMYTTEIQLILENLSE